MAASAVSGKLVDVPFAGNSGSSPLGSVSCVLWLVKACVGKVPVVPAAGNLFQSAQCLSHAPLSSDINIAGDFHHFPPHESLSAFKKRYPLYSRFSLSHINLTTSVTACGLSWLAYCECGGTRNLMPMPKSKKCSIRQGGPRSCGATPLCVRLFTCGEE